MRVLTSILIPTRNQYAMLARALESVAASLQHTPLAAELIIVDNQSDEPESLAWLDALPGSALARVFSHVQVLRHDAAFNYSAINNLAARHSRGEILCFLNNDVEVIADDWLHQLIEHTAEPASGCVGAMLYYPDDTIQHAGVVLGLEKVAAHAFKHLPRAQCGEHPYFSKPQVVSAVTGACLCVRHDVFDAVGGFDEHLAVAYNDIDLCLSVQQAGYRNLWLPGAELYHHESVSRGRRNRGRERRVQHREEIRYMRRKWGRMLRSDPHWQVGRRSLLPGRARALAYRGQSL